MHIAPSPNPTPSGEGDTPSPHPTPLGAFGASCPSSPKRNVWIRHCRPTRLFYSISQSTNTCPLEELSVICGQHYTPWRLPFIIIIIIISSPDVSPEGLKFYPWTLFFFFLFISMHRAQQPRTGRPSNVFRRFGSR